MAIRPPSSNFTICASHIASAGLLASQVSHLGLKGGLVFGACGELSGFVSKCAVRFFTNNTAIEKTTVRAARLLGAHYLGNLALEAAGFTPLAFGSATLLVSLASPVLYPMAIITLNDLWDATFGTPSLNRVRLYPNRRE